MNKINPLNVEELVAYIFDNGQESSLKQFQNDFSEPILSICEHVKKSYANYLLFENHKQPDEQFNLITAHVFCLVESLYTSSKLLVHGYLAPSGNQFRVALEAMALSVLLNCRQNILVATKYNSWKLSDFFIDFKNKKQWTKPHMAIKTLEKNREGLGLSGNAMNLLKSSKDLYNDYSHISILSIHSRIVTPDKLLFGGGYEQEQKSLFEKELQVRKQFTQMVPTFIESLYKRTV